MLLRVNLLLSPKHYNGSLKTSIVILPAVVLADVPKIVTTVLFMRLIDAQNHFQKNNNKSYLNKEGFLIAVVIKASTIVRVIKMYIYNISQDGFFKD